MSTEPRTLWGMHAGKTGDADSLFLKKNWIALGWHHCGDLSKLAADRDSFKAKVAQSYPHKKPGAIPVDAGQLFRFLHEMDKGDLVVYASKRNRTIHIGRVTGPYQYDPKLEPSYPNLRPVQWLKEFPRTLFSQGALYEIGASMSLFQVKNYADEYLTALDGEATVELPDDDDTVGPVVEEIEQNTSAFILKQLSKELKGHPLEEFVAHLLQRMGYRTRVAPEGADGGIDIIAHKDELGVEPPIIKVQVKSTSGNVGEPEASALSGKVANSGEFGLLVTLGLFTKQAQVFARGKNNLRLIDGAELVALILEHYEKLDSKYKGLIPLRRVYVPESLGESDE